jgi:hypothetical protein
MRMIATALLAASLAGSTVDWGFCFRGASDGDCVFLVASVACLPVWWRVVDWLAWSKADFRSRSRGDPCFNSMSKKRATGMRVMGKEAFRNTSKTVNRKAL